MQQLTLSVTSIDDVSEPTKNAVNEKCSRISEAFIKHFDESLAQNYFCKACNTPISLHFLISFVTKPVSCNRLSDC